MTRYTVVWDADVESRFIAAWTAGDSRMRANLTDIANWVDTNLAEDAERKGQALAELDARVIVVPVSGTAARVSVTYQVLPNDRQVRIVRLVFRGP
jgi:hypothetical protein